MPNKPSPHKILCSVRVQRELHAKVLKHFRVAGGTVGDAYILALQFATRNVELDAADYRRIAAEVEAAKRERGGK